MRFRVMPKRHYQNLKSRQIFLINQQDGGW